MPEWAGPDYGDSDRTEMAAIAPIVFDGTAEDATQRLHNRRPRVDERRIAILVRRARQQRNAGHVDDVNDIIHELAVLGVRSLPDTKAAPKPRRRWLSRWWSR